MIGKKGLGLFPAHIPLHDFRFGFRQIHQDQSVEHITEIGINIERQQLATELEVLAQQNRHSGEVGVDIGDQRLDILQVLDRGFDLAQLPLLNRVRAHRLARLDQFGQVGHRLVLLEKVDQQLARGGLVIAVDADRAKQNFVVRIGRNVMRQPLPQYQQRRIVLLILAPNERATHLERRTDLFQQFLPVLEQGAGVEAGFAQIA